MCLNLKVTKTPKLSKTTFCFSYLVKYFHGVWKRRLYFKILGFCGISLQNMAVYGTAQASNPLCFILDTYTPFFLLYKPACHHRHKICQVHILPGLVLATVVEGCGGGNACFELAWAQTQLLCMLYVTYQNCYVFV